MNAANYTYRVEWSSNDGEYVGLCAGFPSLSWLEPVASDALSGIRRTVRDILKDMSDTGETPPEPVSASL